MSWDERKSEFAQAKERGHNVMALIRGKHRFLFLKEQGLRNNICKR